MSDQREREPLDGQPSIADLARLAAQLGMTVREFRDAYCDLDAERKWARYGDLD